MNVIVLLVAFLLFSLDLSGAEARFRWNWRKSGYPREALQSSALAEPEKRAILEAVFNVLRKKSLNLGVPDEKLREIASSARITIVDVTGDGVNEIIASAGTDRDWCSPTGNCPYWIFVKTAEGYSPVLTSFGQTFTIGNRRPSGANDIIIAMHGSATERGLSVYRWTGRVFTQIACYDAVWPYIDECGNTAKEPVLKRCSSK